MTLACQRRRWLLATVIGLILCALARRTPAHDPFEITTAATLDVESMTLFVTMTRASAVLVSGLPIKARAFTPERFADHEPQLRVAARRLYEVSSNREELVPLDARVGLNPEQEVEFIVTYPRPSPGSLQLHATCLALLSEGHGNAVRLALVGETRSLRRVSPNVEEVPSAGTPILPVATLTSPAGDAAKPGTDLRREALGQPENVIALEFLNASDPRLEVQLPGKQPAETAPVTPSAPPLPSFLTLGLRHILTGYDHLLFLAGLLLACRRLSSMLGLITCFTLAHSLTLALAVVDRVPALVSAWVEPLILASIVFVGVQNVALRSEPKYRYALTFGFGLIHGLGFANALTELALGAEGTPVVASLLSFNVGVEIGQMLIAAVVLPLLLQLRKSPRGPAVVRAISVAITSLGAYWLTTGVQTLL